MASSQWTELANRYGMMYSIPPALILALIDLESGGDPSKVAADPRSNATGLMQITGVVIKGYNERHDASLTRADMVDPETNIKLGAETIRRIALVYKKYNGLEPKWQDPSYVGLVVMGWNMGYSRKSGVSYVLSRMQAAGVPKSQWSPKTVHESALQLKNVSPWIRERGTGWTNAVVKRYFKIIDVATKNVAKQQRKEAGKEWSTGKKVLVYGGVAAGVVGTGWWLFNRNKKVEEYEEEQAMLPAQPQIIVVK